MEKYTYEVITTERGTTFVLRSDGAHIPMDDSNSDYQVYLNPDKVEHLTEIPPQAALSTPIVKSDGE